MCWVWFVGVKRLFVTVMDISRVYVLGQSMGVHVIWRGFYSIFQYHTNCLSHIYQSELLLGPSE